MNVKRENLSETKLKLTIEAGELELLPSKEAAVKKLGKNLKVAGFRPGKAPLQVIEQNLDQQLLQSEVMQESLNQLYGQALEKEAFRPLDQPQVAVTKWVPFTELEFTAEVEIMPEVKLGDYKKIKKIKPNVTVSEKDVAEVLENLRTRAAEKKPTKESAKNGDEVIIDFKGTNSKKETVAGADGKDYPLILGSDTFIPGFEAKLVGVKAGDTKDIKLKFPTDYHAKHLAGTDINFAVTVKTVNAVTKAKLDDELAAKVGPFKNLKELKADIKTQLKAQKEQEAVNRVKDEIVEELVKKSKFALPQLLIDDQLKMLEHDITQNLTYRGITKPEYVKQEGFKDEAEWQKATLLPQAERRVSVGIVLAAVSDAENLTVSQDELNNRITAHKQQYRQNAEQFDQPEMQREVASRLLTEKTVDRLYELATK